MIQNTNIEMAKADLKHKLGYSHTIKMIKQSELFNLLSHLGYKSEEELTKVDLYKLIKANCEYMKANNIYEYYQKCYRELIFNGKSNDTNGED